MLKIRRPLGRLIFNMGIAIPGKTVFLIETAPKPLSGPMADPWNTTIFIHKHDFEEVVCKMAANLSCLQCVNSWMQSHQDISDKSPISRNVPAPYPTMHHFVTEMCPNDDPVPDDVIKWKHFPRYWPFVRGIHLSPVNSPHKGQWRGALMFSLICVWINGWANNGEAGDFRRYRAHYVVIVMPYILVCVTFETKVRYTPFDK